MENIEYKKYSKDEMIDIAKNKGFYFVETSNDDYFEILRDEFTRMIYLCRNDTVMLHNIFECFVKHDKKAMATVAKDFIYSL